jgi:hypothetical protein
MEWEWEWLEVGTWRSSKLRVGCWDFRIRGRDGAEGQTSANKCKQVQTSDVTVILPDLEGSAKLRSQAEKCSSNRSEMQTAIVCGLSLVNVSY